MSVERAADHPTFEIAGNTVTSFAAPARGSTETALFRTDLPAGGSLPPHRHDHFDVFVLLEGGATMHIGDTATQVEAGDAVVVPTGELHWLEAGSSGASLVVTMVAGTRFIREDDGTETVLPWLS
ncbi:MAG TPA: cupin domain-containing protein [Actinomycetota bacterium]|jgi:quercetin dioxygenase-like cupin family protein